MKAFSPVKYRIVRSLFS